MSQENIAAVRRGYEMVAAGDIEGLTDTFAPEAEVTESGGIGGTGSATGTRYGFEGFLRGWADAQETFDDFRVVPEDFIEAGDAVVVPAHISGRGKSSGVELDTRVAHLWVFQDGKIIRGDVFPTVEDALEAARRHAE